MLRKYCWGHLKRKQKGLAVEVPLREWGKPGNALRRAATAYADAVTQEEADRAAARLRMAARRSSGQ